MGLYMKQDFTPPVLSRRWVAIKFRPNMLLDSRRNIISILESGLMFREDSVAVEQEAPSPEAVWGAAGGLRGGWLTRGEGLLTAATLTACVALFPPRRFSRTALVNLSVYMSVPVAVRCAHRAACRGALAPLLRCMRDYLALARRAAACLKEFAALHTKLGSLSSVIESTRTMLCRQQSSLAVAMSRASSALLGNAPWLRDDVAWHAVERDETDNLMKIHHAFLVVQSTLLKHIAMAHYIPPPNIQRLYKNHNERLYWLHNTLIKHLLEEFNSNFESLDRMYRLLKNSANRDETTKKLGAVKNNWVYSEIHTGIARANLELKLALNKSNGLDMLLDSCALNNEQIEIDVLNNDVEELIDIITKCMTTVQNSQLRLKKLKGKIVESVSKADDVVESVALAQIDDEPPEAKDEVYFFIKTEDEDITVALPEVNTGPGEREMENTKIVLTELKRKLGKREDLMRERERQALVKTMPELKNIPEFPRQIKFDEYIVKKGYISKIKRKGNKTRLFRCYRIESRISKSKVKKYSLNCIQCVNENYIKGDLYEANAFLKAKSRMFTTTVKNNNIIINKFIIKARPNVDFDTSTSELSELDNKASTVNKSVVQAINNHEVKLKVTKKDLEISDSSSESDFEYYRNQRALLNDIRRHRAIRKKNHPSRPRPIENVDDSLKPIEYSFGAGLAMASVLQANNPKFLNMAQEEVFNGDGEVSNDSGNDEDA